MRAALTSEGVWRRFAALLGIYLALFFVTVVVSHLLLPEGLLRRFSEGRGGDAVDDFGTMVSQILPFNLMSFVVIAVTSLFARRKDASRPFLPVSLTVLTVLFVMNGLVLGTNSFAIRTANTGLVEKTIGLFDLTRYAALWEMAAQLLLAAALFHQNMWGQTGADTEIRRFRDLRLTRAEVAAALLAVVLLVVGALVEANRVVNG